MARTAPVPNIPPIPGMCPSVAVMGGGGGAGGGSGGSGSSGDGSAGAGGDGNGENANGDGTSAASCGQGTGGSCPNHDPGATAGDPVDVATGRAYTVPVVDLLLPGPLPLRFARTYSTFARTRDVGLGWGWSHSLAWELEVRRGNLRLWKPDGTFLDFRFLEDGQRRVAPGGVSLQRLGDTYAVDPGDRCRRTLTAADDSGKRFRLTGIRDRNGNVIEVHYDQDRLVGITDCVGRQIRLVPGNDRRIKRLEVLNAHAQGRWVTMATYSHDDEGDLVLAEDADGHRTGFEYDDHLLTAHRRPTGLTFHWVYDERGRCVETWGDYPGAVDPALSPDAPATLADGTTPAKGILHCRISYDSDGYREVTDSRRVDRYRANAFGKMDQSATGGSVTTRTYDALGNETSKTDANGATWRYGRDAEGRLLRVVDPLERTTLLERDATGLLIQGTDARGGVTRYERDARGNVTSRHDALGGASTYRYDDRGLLVEQIDPNGDQHHYRYDELGQLVASREADGSEYRHEFDFLGRRVASINPRGDRLRFVWSNGGRLTQEIDPLGGVTEYEYDGIGNLVRHTRADGSTFRYTWGGLHWMAGIDRPDGSTVRAGYGREGQLLRLENGAGEATQFEYDVRGFLVGEALWDGRELRYGYDPVGQVTHLWSSRGDLLELEYDLAGQLVKKVHADGSEIALTWDELGQLIGAANADSRVDFERDALGGIVKETQTLRGETVVVDSSYDARGGRLGRSTSLGHHVSYERDARGRAIKTTVDGLETETSFDPVGLEIERQLPGGGRIRSDHDELGRLKRRYVPGAGGQIAVGDGEPDWVGPRPGGGLDRSFAYDKVSNLVLAGDPASQSGYRYDSVDQLRQLDVAGGHSHRLTYDTARNALPEGGAGARYAPGNRLLRWENTEYSWDPEGRLLEKELVVDERRETWRYAWRSDGALAEVERPDGGRVRFAYDVFGRRLEKRVEARASSGELRHVRSTRYVWDRDQLCQEVTTDADGTRHGRNYLYSGHDHAALAHVDVDYEADDRRAFFYANDPAGTPDYLVDGAGAEACRLEPTPWGRRIASADRTQTPIRKQGEYFDDETGLAYNRHRYLDPQTGRFIQPDPIGLGGGMNLYRSGPNSVGWVDPFGLTDESDRASDIRDNQGGVGWGTTYAVARLSNGDTVVVDSRGSLHPGTRVRDPDYQNSRTTPGAAASGGITEDEWQQHASPDSNPEGGDNPHHGERRIIEHCRDVTTDPNNPVTIESISATNNVCPTCRAAIRAHSPGAQITNRDGTPAPNP